MNDDLPARIQATAEILRQRLGPLRPRVAVLLGSGWGGFAAQVQGTAELPCVELSYAELPAFPLLAIGGHAGRLQAGCIADVEVVVLSGRKHAYENGQADGMKGAIRSLAAIGVQVLVQTNAAGSMDPRMRPGELMLITDHLNLVQRSPLFNEPGDQRFVAMAGAYCPRLQQLARACAQQRQALLHEGVYAWVMGPQFETPAEIRMLQTLGAQAVGMSTVPETILARHAGLRVLALSMMTNMAAGLSDEKLSHGHTLATAKAGGDAASALLAAIVAALSPELKS